MLMATLSIQAQSVMEEATALAADDEAVAVGKLREAIQWANDNNDESNLQDAIDQFKADNADQEKDETAKVAITGWKRFNSNTSADMCATQYAPAITTYDGRYAQLAEVYETTTATTGQIIYQNITGLANGKYKVGFYGNAFYTSGRGFSSDMAEGANDVAYVFANEQQAFITAHIATSTSENDFRQFDVEVTDGTIKLGMGKAKAGTNWHTMQIYQLTWFTTAKEAYANAQADLAELVSKAEGLLDEEFNNNGRDELAAILETAKAAVGSNWYNIPEIEAIIGNLRPAIENFIKANYYIDFAAGNYYIVDAESGLMISAGKDWGTQGIVDELGLDLTLIPNSTTRTIAIDSRIDNGNNDHYLGSNLYMDSPECVWALQYVGFGFYITDTKGQYISINSDNELILSTTPREWIIVTSDGIRMWQLDELEEATAENPVDATFLIKAHNFNRNDTRNAEAWSISTDCTNHNLSGGNNLNNCAESYHSTFTISQAIKDAPAGTYTMTAQGFYRQDNSMEEDKPEFFIGNVSAELPAMAGSENNMADASVSFTRGDYTIEPIMFYHNGEGDLTIGVRGTATSQWVIFDNFRLSYLGPEDIPSGINATPALNKAEGALYDLSGRRISKPTKGIYIQGGRKIAIK